MDLCEHGNEFPGSIKCEKYPEQLNGLFARQEGVCFKKLVSVSCSFSVIQMVMDMEEVVAVYSFDVFMVEEIYFLRTVVTCDKTTWHHRPGDHNQHLRSIRISNFSRLAYFKIPTEHFLGETEEPLDKP